MSRSNGRLATRRAILVLGEFSTTCLEGEKPTMAPVGFPQGIMRLVDTFASSYLIYSASFNHHQTAYENLNGFVLSDVSLLSPIIKGTK